MKKKFILILLILWETFVFALKTWSLQFLNVILPFLRPSPQIFNVTILNGARKLLFVTLQPLMYHEWMFLLDPRSEVPWKTLCSFDLLSVCLSGRFFRNCTKKLSDFVHNVTVSSNLKTDIVEFLKKEKKNLALNFTGQKEQNGPQTRFPNFAENLAQEFSVFLHEVIWA